MNLLIELVRGTGAGTSLKLELLEIKTGNLLEDALIDLADAVEAKLSYTLTLHPKSWQSYSDRMTAYDTTLKATYMFGAEHSHDVEHAPDGTAVTVKFAPDDEDSVYVPGANKWSPIEGKTYRFVLGVGSATTDEKALATAHTYYLQIRAAAVIGDCTYTISTEPLWSGRGDPSHAQLKSQLKGVTLFMSHTRSIVLSVRGKLKDRGQTDRRHPQLIDDAKNIWTYEHTPELTDDGKHARLRVRFIGDPVHIRAATLLTDDGSLRVAIDGPRDACEPFFAPPSVFDLARQNDLFGLGVTWEIEMERRHCLMGRLEGDISAYRFFYDLDNKSSPDSEHGEQYAWLGALLSAVYMRRASFFDDTKGDVIETSKEEMVAIGPHLMLAADLVLKTMREHFSTGDEIDFDAVDDAFMRFACGRLQIFDTHGAPNGVNMFAFPELARMCVVLGRHAETWTRLFTIFARASEVFVRSYHTLESEARSICAYRVENNPDGLRGPSEEQEAALREAWALPNPEKRFSELVHGALFDETKKTHRPPMELVDYTAS